MEEMTMAVEAGTIIDRILSEVSLEDGLMHLLGGLPDDWKTDRDRFSVRCIIPGHTDRHASMSVYARQGRCWCHVCHQGGNLINLTQILLNVDAKGAIDFWCQQLGISKVKPDQEAQRRLDEAKQLQELRQYAHLESLKVERCVPRPKNDFELSVLDEIFHEKDILEERHGKAQDTDSLRDYICALWIWEAWAKGVWEAATGGPQRTEEELEEMERCLTTED